ncbi:hypothetical protein OIV83_000910 [Microbotryomycetes sp. JL201]|nr:hypothetical protein OIV83_000910 [Microbotryomycetes sp. JL201]
MTFSARVQQHRRTPSHLPTHHASGDDAGQSQPTTARPTTSTAFRSFQNANDYLMTRRQHQAAGTYDGDKGRNKRAKSAWSSWFLRPQPKALIATSTTTTRRRRHKIVLLTLVVVVLTSGAWLVWFTSSRSNGGATSFGLRSDDQKQQKQATLETKGGHVVNYAKELRNRIKPVIVGRGASVNPKDRTSATSPSSSFERDGLVYIDTSHVPWIQVDVPKTTVIENSDQAKIDTAPGHKPPGEIPEPDPVHHPVKVSEDQADAQKGDDLPNELWQARMARVADKSRPRQQIRLDQNKAPPEYDETDQDVAVRGHVHDKEEWIEDEIGAGGQFEEEDQYSQETRDVDEDGGTEPDWRFIEGGRPVDDDDGDSATAFEPEDFEGRLDGDNEDDDDLQAGIDFGDPKLPRSVEDEDDDGFDDYASEDDAIARARDSALLEPDVELIEQFEALDKDQLRQLSVKELNAFKEATALQRRRQAFLDRLRRDGVDGPGLMPPDLRPRFRGNKLRREILKQALDRVWPKLPGDGDAEQEQEEEEQQQDQQLQAAVRRKGLRKRDIVDSDAPVLSNSSSLSPPPEPAGRLVRRSVNPRSAPVIHPIPQLIKDAETAWTTLVSKQSSTLKQAFKEYRRRYRRNPPRGFDQWWRFVVENQVQLPDEYDQIDHDILPFLSLSSKEMRRRQRLVNPSTANDDEKSQTFVIRVENGQVEVSGHRQRSLLAEDTVDLLKAFAGMMPGKDRVELVVSTSNTPEVAVTADSMKRHVEAAEGKQLLPSGAGSPNHRGPASWSIICPARGSSEEDAMSLPDTKSFISGRQDLGKDVCLHPKWRNVHGFTLRALPSTRTLMPLLSTSKLAGFADLVVPSLNGFFQQVGTDVDWALKNESKVLWRGRTTGLYYDAKTDWRNSHRARLVREFNPIQTDKTTLHVLVDETRSHRASRFSAQTKNVVSHYFDVSYEGKLTQCDRQDGTCERLLNEFRIDPNTMDRRRTNDFKYVLDVDEDGPSQDFRRKITIFDEWWSKRLVPWYHYVPVKPDYSDLTDLAAFFTGSPGSEGNDDLAKLIADRGRRWVEIHWRRADLVAYWFRFMLEYNRLLNRDEDGSHDFLL